MIAFSIFGFSIYWYGIFYFMSFIIGYIFLYFVFRSSYLSSFPQLQKKIIVSLDDIIFIIMLGVLVGGRLGHVFIYDFSYFLQEPLKILAIWQGGMSFIGGMIGVFLSLCIYVYKKKFTKEDLFILLDIILVITPLGILFGRLGNYLNQELYGIIVPSDYRGLPQYVSKIFISTDIFYVYSSVDSYLRVNTNLLSMFFEGFLLFSFMIIGFLYLKKKNLLRPGLLLGIFLVIYSFFRFMLEYVRQDSQYEFMGLFSRSQWFFVVFFCLGIYFILYSKNKKIT